MFLTFRGQSYNGSSFVGFWAVVYQRRKLRDKPLQRQNKQCKKKKRKIQTCTLPQEFFTKN